LALPFIYSLSLFSEGFS